MGFKKTKNQRKTYNNEKVVMADGQKADSKLEAKMRQRLLDKGIEHEFQKTFVLQETFKTPNGKTIRRMTTIVDFYMVWMGEELIIDTKGYSTEMACIRWKLLEKKLTEEGRKYRTIWLRNEAHISLFMMILSRGVPMKQIGKLDY
jgi:hypothetical protein